MPSMFLSGVCVHSLHIGSLGNVLSPPQEMQLGRSLLETSTEAEHSSGRLDFGPYGFIGFNLCFQDRRVCLDNQRFRMDWRK